MWNIEVNDILETNLEAIRKIYNAYVSSEHYKFITFAHCQDLFGYKAFSMSEKEILFNFGASKMTVADENKDEQKYSFLYFVEFLEMLGRCAASKMSGTELESLPLVTKLEYFLDEMFAAFGLHRKQVNIQQNEQTESDEDY